MRAVPAWRGPLRRRLGDFGRDPRHALDTVLSIVIFTVPGVVIGGRLGSQLARRASDQRLVRFLGWLFLGIAAVTLGGVLRRVEPLACTA